MFLKGFRNIVASNVSEGTSALEDLVAAHSWDEVRVHAYMQNNFLWALQSLGLALVFPHDQCTFQICFAAVF